MLLKIDNRIFSMVAWPRSLIATVAAPLCFIALVFVTTVCGWSQQQVAVSQSALSLEECITIAHQIQPSIQAQQSGVAAADEQRKIARSLYKPQVGFQAQYTHLDESRTVDVEDVYTDEIVDVFSDAAAFFQIARQAGSSTANFGLDNPNTPLFPGGPSFGSAKQAAAAAIPQDVRIGLLGANSLITQTQLVQPLWTGGKLDARNVQADLGVKAAGLNVVKSQHQVAFNVTRAYLTVLLAMELERAATDATGQTKAIEQLVESYVKAGNRWVTTADFHRAQSYRLLFEEQQVGFQRGRERAKSALKLSMGLEQEAQVTIAATELPTERRFVDWNMIRQFAESRQPDLMRAHVGEQIASQEVRAARAEYRPDVAFFGSMTTFSDDENFANPNNPQEFSAGVTAQIPVYTGGRRRAQMRRAQHLQTKSSQVRKQVAQAVTQEARDAYLEYQEMEQRMAISAKAVDAAEATSRSLNSSFQLGLDSTEEYPDHFKDVLTTRLLLLTTQTKYNQALFGYNLALARLKLVTVSNELPSHEPVHVGADADETNSVESSNAIQFRFSDRGRVPTPLP